MNILITGGAGFMGSYFIRYLLEKYPQSHILNLDKLTYAASLERLRDVEKKFSRRYRFLKGDIADKTAVEGVFKEFTPDVVVDFAAESVIANTFIPIHYRYGIKIVAIEELFTIYAKKRDIHTNTAGVEIIECKLPLFALSFYNGMGQWRRITHITRHRYTGKVVRLRQKWGDITITPNHSVYNAEAQLKIAQENPELLAIRKINADKSRYRDYLKVRIRGVNSKNGFLYTPTADGRWRSRDIFVRQLLKGESLSAFMRFLGAYVAEGNMLFNKANGSWQICIANSDIKFLEQLQKDAKLFTNTAGSITKRDLPNAHQLVFSSHILYEVVKTLCGTNSHCKQVPDALYTLRDKYKSAFLACYLKGDGNIQFYKTVKTPRLTTNSPKLVAGIGLLISLMGMDYSLNYRDWNKEEKREWRPIYSLSFVSSYDSRIRCKHDEYDYNGFVYDLTVEGTHNFAAGIGNIVVHNTHVDRSILEPADFIRTDLIGTYTLLEGARKFGVKRFIKVSTDEVFGSIEKGKFTEESPFQPNSPYSASKAGGDLLCRAYFKTYGAPVIVTHFCNFLGPWQHPEKFIPLFITNFLEGKKAPLYGTGRNKREWIYVFDVASALDLLLQKGVIGEVYNIGSGEEKENWEVATQILRFFGRDESFIVSVNDRPGHDARYALSSDKIMKLGFSPQYSFDRALRETIEWYKDNRNWWEAIKHSEGFQEYYKRQYPNL